MTGRRAPAGRLSWTRLGAVMGYTRDKDQREQILTVIGRMTWTPAAACPPCRPAVRAVAAALFRADRDALRLVGTAGLGAGRQLIGLAGAGGIRRYLLDLDGEAVYVLTELDPLRVDAVDLLPADGVGGRAAADEATGCRSSVNALELEGRGGRLGRSPAAIPPSGHSGSRRRSDRAATPGPVPADDPIHDLLCCADYRPAPHRGRNVRRVAPARTSTASAAPTAKARR